MCRFKRFTVEAKRTASTAKRMMIVFALLSTLTPQFAYAQGNGLGNGRGNGRGNGNSFQQHGKGSQASDHQGNRQSGARGYNSIGGTLTPAQVGQLVRMREEEKLAHDVYVSLAQSSGLQIFNNIANAESQHMRAVEQLASRYSSAAAANLPVGSFSDPQFQSTL